MKFYLRRRFFLSFFFNLKKKVFENFFKKTKKCFIKKSKKCSHDSDPSLVKVQLESSLMCPMLLLFQQRPQARRIFAVLLPRNKSVPHLLSPVVEAVPRDALGRVAEQGPPGMAEQVGLRHHRKVVMVQPAEHGLEVPWHCPSTLFCFLFVCAGSVSATWYALVSDVLN